MGRAKIVVSVLAVDSNSGVKRSDDSTLDEWPNENQTPLLRFWVSYTEIIKNRERTK